MLTKKVKRTIIYKINKKLQKKYGQSNQFLQEKIGSVFKDECIWRFWNESASNNRPHPYGKLFDYIEYLLIFKFFRQK